jgi:hypothetical protein
MYSSTRQVPTEAGLRADLDAWMRARNQPPFEEFRSAKRRYPGEGEGNYLTAYLNHSEPSAAFLKSLRVLQEVDQAKEKKDVATIRRLLKRGWAAAYRTFVDAVYRSTSKHPWNFDIHESGVIVQPKTPEGKAALAAMLLQGCLLRIRQCLHCGMWFYARFKSQKFCANPETKCQWNHYHSLEWRKKNRARNRSHQRKYREGLFGKRGKS